MLLNRKWRSISQTPHLYAHHLSRCPSFALTNPVLTGPFTSQDLPRLRRKFAQEIKRNLFESYLRPRRTLINLISTSTSSSAAFPRGEAFRFVFSPHGQTLLALSSSRIFVLDLTTEPVSVRRELKTYRRPVSAAVLDDGSILAVLSSKHQANIYSLARSRVQHTQVLVLDNPSHTIALAPEGTVLAAAYEGGVEVYSLAVNALSTDRRSVRCETIDSLSFSTDGAMLLGSTMHPPDPNVVIITAPYYTEHDPDLLATDIQSRMWTTQILFPTHSQDCSHATLLPSHSEGESGWMFAHDRKVGTYRAVQVDNTKAGVAYFIGPTSSRRRARISPRTVPAVSANGDLVAAGFSDSGLWLYGVPERIDSAPDMSHVFDKDDRHSDPTRLTSATVNRQSLLAYSPPASASSDGMGLDLLLSQVDWRRNLFVKGRLMTNIDGLEAARWVESSSSRYLEVAGKDRLAVVAPGGVSAFAEEMGEEQMPADGGRILLLDFEHAIQDGKRMEITIDIGENEPELLPEQNRNLDVEVALLRRRTILQNQVGAPRRRSLGRSATAVGSPSQRPQAHRSGSSSASIPSTPQEDDVLEDLDGFGSPYVQGQPRSRDSLSRAATAAAASRHRHPARPPRGTATGHVVYRRPGGRGELPHESDADNWVPPPPPYSEDAEGPLPEHLRLTLLPRNFTDPAQRRAETPTQPHRSNTRLEEMAGSAVQSAVQHTRNTIARVGSVRAPRGRGLSESSLNTTEGSVPWSDSRQPGAPPLTRFSSTASSVGSSISAMSLADSTPTIRRRPVSADVLRQSSGSSVVMRANLTSPISQIPAIPERRANTSSAARSITPRSDTLPPRADSLPLIEPLPSLDTDISHTASLSEAAGNNITLSGSNLHHRLNYPVPPTPTRETETNYVPPSLRIGEPVAPTLLPANSNSEPFTSVTPTPDQLSNLNRRLTQRRPAPVNTTHNRSGSWSRDVAPSPPRAAVGAVGASPPSLGNLRSASTLNAPMSRSSSRSSSNHSFSASTPNLQRPEYRRLDTIHSVEGGRLPGERSRSRSQDVGLRMPVGMTTAITSDRRVVSDPRETRSRRSGRKSERGSDDGTEKRRGMKCIVM